MHAYAIDFKNTTVRGFATTTLANEKATEEESVITREGQILDDKSATNAALVAFYNTFAEQAGAKQRGKFDNRAQGAEFVFGVLETLVARNVLVLEQGEPAPVTDTTAEVDPAAKPSGARKQPAARTAAAPATTGAKGRNGAYAGMVLRPTAKALQENYRRHGVSGYYSLEVIRSYPNGILYEDYVALAGANAGGNHIKWDIAHGGVTVHDDDGTMDRALSAQDVEAPELNTVPEAEASVDDEPAQHAA